MNEISYALFSTPHNKKVISELREKGGNIFLVLPCETELTDLNDKEEIILKNITNFDWIVFTDTFSVDYFIEFLQKIDFDVLELDSVRICTFGEAVSDKLRFSEIHSDIIATSLESDKIASSIKQYLGKDDFSETSFLILRENSNNLDLTDKIMKESGEVTQVSIYKINEINLKETAKIKALILGGAVDEFIFSDPADLIFFQKIFKVEDELADFSEMKFLAANEIMYQMLFENGLKPTFLQINKKG